MEISQNTQSSIYTLLGLDTLSKEDQRKAIMQIGNAALESTLFRFVLTMDDWANESFKTWVEDNAADVDFLEKLVTLHPKFGDLLVEEILALRDNPII
jgi:hypothetical protein